MQDDNLLACPEDHVRSVFTMLAKQPHPAIFSGGLEAKLLEDWHIDLLASARVNAAWFAYDTESDKEPLWEAGKRLATAGMKAERPLRCYVLVGFPGDSMGKAEARLRFAYRCGFWPFAMLYRDESGQRSPEWAAFQRLWARPAITRALLKKEMN